MATTAGSKSKIRKNLSLQSNKDIISQQVIRFPQEKAQINAILSMI
jgi:hypothetical protein